MNGVLQLTLWLVALAPMIPAATAEPGRDLGAQVRGKGWIAFSAPSPAGDWDVFVMRPDGSSRRALTQTPGFHEAGVRFSPGGSNLLFYRMPRSEPLDNNTYGTFDLVVTDPHGGNAVELGRGFPWATWGPDGRVLACLSPRGIRLVDLSTRAELKTLPRRGVVQQLTWSPDGRHFAGTANGLGPFWNVGVLPADGASVHAVSETERYNCTPDWWPDSSRLLYSRGIVGGQTGFAQLWSVNADGTGRKMLWAESQRHIYGGCASPDGNHLLFTRSKHDLGAVAGTSTTLALVRTADLPMLGDDDPSLQAAFPFAGPARFLDLGPGWEPHWTFSEAPTPARQDP